MSEKLKLSDPDFLMMPVDQLRWWVSKMPFILRQQINEQLISPIDTRQVRIWLESMFGGGFEHMRKQLPISEMTAKDGQPLTNDEIKIKKHALLSKTEKAKLRLWHMHLPGMGLSSKVALQDFLHHILLKEPVINGRKVKILDRRGDLASMRQEEGM
ncbi:hypothetical protein E8E12_004118 [Didymella heteroderae]|uniref:Uncharacterized protein n=1 Tax=Didymella heteroderae TaxID=1769908 RepID=A0A9P4WP65_9PLEO|nr:hypothetical protein E8E12_004118 [Didymella heteroderae]